MTLPFSRDEFFEVFRAYNEALWPYALALWLGTIVVPCLVVFSKGSFPHRIVALLLTALWAWVSLAYHWFFFSKINPASGLFSAAFAIQAGLFAWNGVIKDRFRFTFGPSIRSFLSQVLIAYGIAYPVVNWMEGYRFPTIPTFGIPCPTVILTIGFLLAANSASTILKVIPVLLAFVGGSAAFLLGITADWVLLGAGVMLLYVTMRPLTLVTASLKRSRFQASSAAKHR